MWYSKKKFITTCNMFSLQLVGHNGNEKAVIMIHIPMLGENFLVVMQLIRPGPQWESLANIELRTTFTVHSDGEKSPSMVSYIHLGANQIIYKTLQDFSTGNLCLPSAPIVILWTGSSAFLPAAISGPSAEVLHAVFWQFKTAVVERAGAIV